MRKLDNFILSIAVLFPLFSLAGNILPPLGGMKINVVFSGFLVLLSVLKIILSGKEKLIFPFIIIILFHLILGVSESLKTLTSLYSAFFILLALPLDAYITKGRFLFSSLSLIPMIIAILQVSGFLPIAIGNLEFVNETMWGGSSVVRPNGYLYSAYELTVVTVLALIVVYYRFNDSFNKLFFMILTSYIILLFRLRTGLIFWVLFCFLELKKLYGAKRSKIIFLPVAIGLFTFFIFENIEFLRNLLQFSKLESAATRGQFLTGRFNIWLAVIDSIINADLKTILLGFGDDYSNIFTDSQLWTSDYIPGTHNILLEYLAVTGVIGLLYACYLIKSFFRKLEYRRDIRLSLILIFVFLTLSLGMTGPLFQNPFFGIGFYFLVKSYQQNKNKNEVVA